ncbi:MAG: OmpA family protein [Bacteroidales bacterium]
MKKVTVLMLSLICVVFASNAQEITYVEDPSQGLLINKPADNWFVSAEVGGNVMTSKFDGEIGFGDRIGFGANISAGKWFTPVLGVRVGIDFASLNGASTENGRFLQDADGSYYQQSYKQFGPRLDLMANLTNMFCGYKSDRMYNAILTGGVSANFLYAKDAADVTDYAGGAYGVQLGFLNTFAVSKSVDILLELREDVYQINLDLESGSQYDFGTSLMVGVAYKFNKSDWNSPIVPVCPEYKYTDAEGDALVAQLKAADNKIVAVESQLKEALARPIEVVEVVEDVNVATLYYKIGSSTLSSVNVNAVKAIAAAMKADTDQKYVITGWADSYTGSAKWNSKLSDNRANAVVKILKAQGVSDDQYEVKVNDGNLTEYGKKSASLDRAVTIDMAE